ncbi:MAG: WXG100 family type VII secretion target [Actinomycetaceae bacterium]|nr:WXG100 family type VII secretion target [Actinomycetaceae bacterium]MDO5747021.1 WXG100 family type VII secretion target [Actinomycetaceae bacterium]
MAQFNVDSQLVQQASATTKTIGDQIRADVATMMAHLHQLSSSWTGTASVAFQDCATQWKAAQAQVDNSLDSISAALACAADTYEQAETQTANMFSAR